jgi:hypothetical protein
LSESSEGSRVHLLRLVRWYDAKLTVLHVAPTFDPVDARGVPATASHYEPRDPAQSVLFQVVRDQFETFRAQTASLREGEGPPRFVEREFREFLTCGCLAAGFALWPGAASDTSL